MLYKAFYEDNKKLIDNVSEKIIEMFRDYEKIVNARLLDKMSSEQIEEILNKQPAYYERYVIYEIYQNSYDPRGGKTLAVYIPSHFDREFILSSCQKLFGEYNLRDKKGCKESNYRVYENNETDLIFKDCIENKTTLNLIFTNTPILQMTSCGYFQDYEKYIKFLSKAPKDLIY